MMKSSMTAKRILFLLVTGMLLVIVSAAIARVVPGMQEQEEADSEAMPAKQPPQRSTLKFGKAVKAAGEEISIPLHFSAAAGETVGVIRASVKVPNGPWQFRKLELPEGSQLKTSAKERTTKNRGVETRIIEIEVSYGSRVIRNGTLGFLVFSHPSTGAATEALPEELAVGKLETGPPVPELVSPGSAPRPIPLPSEPPMNPAQTCFFFSH